MRPLIQLCLADGAVDGPILARLLAEHDVGFDPVELRCEGRTLRPGKAGLAELAKRGSIRHARADGPGSTSFGLTSIAGWDVDQLVWMPPAFPAQLSLVDDVIGLPGFTAGYLGDGEDARWQSETDIDEYEQSGRGHAHLKKVREGFLGPKSIDITGNPGRRTSFAGFWLWAAATMWFGPPAFRYLDRDRLLSCSFAPVTEAGEGVLRVDLFPVSWYEENLDAMRERQAAFRDLMRFDELEARADEVMAELSNAEAGSSGT